jgi:DNA mismatch repair protein MutL
VSGTRVRILPDHVANQIAAGEVVERPASAVKELVENSLDAGAGSVRVEVRNGGKTFIRVADDGLGMSRADALLSLERHATSKIRSSEDLAGVASFGFRGEAIPSIAAVSRFELETAPADGGTGTRIRVADGRILSTDEIARQPGTTVTVRSLFQSVPVRAKFLRAASAETRAVSEAVLLLALSHVRASFRLESSGRELLDLPPAAGLNERVADIWGAEEAGRLLEVNDEVDGMRVGGLIQRPDAARPSGGRRYLFVNGRPFRDPGTGQGGGTFSRPGRCAGGACRDRAPSTGFLEQCAGAGSGNRSQWTRYPGGRARANAARGRTGARRAPVHREGRARRRGHGVRPAAAHVLRGP